MRSNLKQVLCIEDSAADRFLVTSFLCRGDRSCDIHFAEDGEKGRDFLFRRGDFAEAHRPDLVLLDLNLPRLDGREILKELKRDPDLKHIPVIVLTTSEQRDDINQVYSLGANAFFTKPTDLTEYESLLALIETHWVRTVRLPDATV